MLNVKRLDKTNRNMWSTSKQYFSTLIWITGLKQYELHKANPNSGSYYSCGFVRKGYMCMCC